MSMSWGHRGCALVARASCRPVTTQGSSNTAIADNVVNDITVYGRDLTVRIRAAILSSSSVVAH